MDKKNKIKKFKRDVHDSWNENSDYWDSYMGEEGRTFQKILIGPVTEKLLDLKPGEKVLDIACGNGAFTRRMAQLGAIVTGCDFSEKQLKHAEKWTKENKKQIEYKFIDATNEAKLLSLGKQRFDAAVCTMAMMDMVVIEPLISALRQILKLEGRFVFSVMHPCFNTNGVTKIYEEEERNGKLTGKFSVKVERYIQQFIEKGIGIVGQPVAQYYFHRPLNILLNSFFHSGFIMDAFEEPVFTEPKEITSPLGWGSFQEIPPVIIVRMRLRKEVI
jgi:2-polyprenyl-3-methyl-5-hydroxy-6-metoxy-1,4-benzoquinol methylase